MHLIENERYRTSLANMLEKIDLSMLAGRTVLVSGASGMLGSCLVDALMLWHQGQVAAASRSIEKAKERFGYCWTDSAFSFWQQNICEPVQNLPEKCDYIIHAASNADPVKIASDPVQTLLANVAGTENLLRYGQAHGMQRFLYVSSGEVYGQPGNDIADFTEDYCGPLDLSSPRSCYPEGKRAAEVLCQSYIHQYGVDAVIVRPCHLFGPTMNRKDSRAVCEFLWSAMEGQDITLKSAGTLERSHCYVVDAVQAILLVLCKGECGRAYNIADSLYQMTIREFAERVAEAGECQVVFDLPNDLEQKGYSKAKRMVLAPLQMEKLGWLPMRRICSPIKETIQILRDCT